MHRSLLITPLVLALAVAGCAAPTKKSSPKFTGDKGAVAKTIESLQTASQPGRSNPGKVCEDLVTADLQRQLAAHGDSCKGAVNDALRNADAYQLTTQTVQISGSQAIARVKVETGKNDRVQTLTLQKQGVDWRISRFG